MSDLNELEATIVKSLSILRPAVEAAHHCLVVLVSQHRPSFEKSGGSQVSSLDASLNLRSRSLLFTQRK